jgi:DNA-binding MarR family transcriptional regulator
MSFAAVAKHVSVLEKAGLVTKSRSGKEKVIHLEPKNIKVAEAHLSQYEKVWSDRFNALEKLLEEDDK